MKRLVLLLAALFPSLLGAATYPNYFVTTASPFDVVPGVSVYVPTFYSTNGVFTNLTVKDYMFIGTAQVNYLDMLGGLNQQGQTYTNYFMADSNYFRGSITSGNTVTAVQFLGNVENSTNSSGEIPLFNGNTMRFLSLTDEVAFTLNESGPGNGGLMTVAGTAGVATNLHIGNSMTPPDNLGNVLWVLDVGTNDNISLGATDGSAVIGKPPAGTTNTVNGLYVYGNSTATGTNSASEFVSTAAPVTNRFYCADEAGTGRITNEIVRAGGTILYFYAVP